MTLSTRNFIILLAITCAIVATLWVLDSRAFYAWQQKRMVKRVLTTDPAELLSAGRALLASRAGFVGEISPSSLDVPSAIRRLKPTLISASTNSLAVDFGDVSNPFGVIVYAAGANPPGEPKSGYGQRKWMDGLWLYDDGQLEKYGHQGAPAGGIRPIRSETNRTNHDSAPQQVNDGWTTSSLNSVGMNSNLTATLLTQIKNGTYKNIHSILIVKDGKLVVEEYFPGQEEDGRHLVYQADTLHGIHSATKSINSILIGIAIDQELIRSVDEKISTFFPEHADLFADGKRDAICLKHLLSMTAGLSWDEWTNSYADPRNDHVAMNRSKDPVRYALERPVVAAPGTQFAYSSGISIVLGEIIYKVSGLRADKFAERHLFGPLGISNYSWLKYPNGVVQTGGGLSLRPRDMAKMGYLVLRGGRWQGKQIISEQWLEESLKQHAPDRAYGYQWWLGQLQVRDQKVAVGGAQGRGGQFILVIPSVQMVAVFTGWNDGNGFGEQPFEMLQRFVLPAALPGTTTSPR